ncbi:MAG: CPBP family intramembrane metalloprotease [Phycisphaerales bacterium]|nr:MAG: CPBP family intramembrane metalloprotease [Phycisphaerales bacterium]
MTIEPPEFGESPARPGPADFTPAAVPLARPVHAPSPSPASPMLLTERSRSAALLELGVFALLVLFLSLAVGQLGWAARQFELVKSEQTALLGSTIVFSVLAVACLVAVLKRGGGNFASVGLAARGLGVNVALGIAAAVAAFGAFYVAIGILYLVYTPGYESMQSNAGELADSLPKLHPIGFFLLSIWVGVWEELAFRGFVLTRLRRVFGRWWPAVLISSILFALPHMETQMRVMTFPLFMIAVTWALITIWRKSLIPAIIGHALFDFIMLIFVFYGPAGPIAEG